MPKKNTPAFEPDAEYRVRLKRPVTIAGGRVLKPLNEHVIRGAYLAKIVAREGEDAIDRADKR